MWENSSDRKEASKNEQVIIVNQFVGPNYTKGRIGFRHNGEVVPFAVGDNHGSKYHIELEEIKSLARQFPDYLTAYKKEQHGNIQNWGEQVAEVGLCQLMMEEKLVLERTQDENPVFVHFKWDGPKWRPGERPTRR